MPKKKSSRKASSPKGKRVQPGALDRRGLEKSTTDLHKLLQSREFGSIDEVNAFLQETLASGLPQPIPASQTTLEQAQDVMYQAWEAHGAQRAPGPPSVSDFPRLCRCLCVVG